MMRSVSANLKVLEAQEEAYLKRETTYNAQLSCVFDRLKEVRRVGIVELVVVHEEIKIHSFIYLFVI